MSIRASEQRFLLDVARTDWSGVLQKARFVRALRTHGDYWSWDDGVPDVATRQT